jgi:hypothetical protein
VGVRECNELYIIHLNYRLLNHRDWEFEGRALENNGIYPREDIRHPAYDCKYHIAMIPPGLVSSHPQGLPYSLHRVAKVTRKDHNLMTPFQENSNPS